MLASLFECQDTPGLITPVPIHLITLVPILLITLVQIHLNTLVPRHPWPHSLVPIHLISLPMHLIILVTTHPWPHYSIPNTSLDSEKLGSE